MGATFGVSAFQIYFGAEDVTTAGDAIDVLVAMNPAALVTNLDNLIDGGLIIVDSGAFTAKNLAKAKYETFVELLLQRNPGFLLRNLILLGCLVT